MTAAHLKTPLAKSLSSFAEKKVNDALQLTGKGLPCSVVKVSGQIVTVKFELTNIPFTLPQVTIPIATSIYIRLPVQVGDKGAVIPSDAYMGGISGLGGGVADLTQRANLSSLTYLPISNTQWSAVDPNAVNINGPNGVVLRDTTTACTFVLTPASITMVAPQSVSVECGTSKLVLTPTSYLLQGTSGEISDGTSATSATIMNQVWALLETFLNTHIHTNGNGGGNTGAAVTPYTGGNIAP